MTYRVLARKWRPKTLDDLVGQPALVQTLRASIERQQLHHAYLFTGTRGVGKTSIARILAKCLNCEQGITATPCLKCDACTAIAEGRFADLIEVDAASRTRVEETRDLLDNVPYAPTQGRFKVYLIDEVHMLSTHSFNALLKTLEEPPEHVKFFLATTDPHRLPVTILSRCLQFHLKSVSPDELFAHLSRICELESVTFTPDALRLVAQAAGGSVRDSLSLLEQAIAFGQGKVEAPQVRQMLGAASERVLLELIALILKGDAASALAIVDKMAEEGTLFENALEQCLLLMHQICLVQQVPQRIDAQTAHPETLLELAGQISSDRAQLVYQLCLYAKRDFSLAPDARTAFEMFVLRLCSFHREPSSIAPIQKVAAQPVHTEGPLAKTIDATLQSHPLKEPVDPESIQWNLLLKQLPLSGLNKIILDKAQVISWSNPMLTLQISAEHESCLSDERKRTLEAMIAKQAGTTVKISVRYHQKEQPVTASQTTQATRPEMAVENKQAHFEQDSDLQSLVDAFDATIEKVTVLKNEKQGENS